MSIDTSEKLFTPTPKDLFKGVDTGLSLDALYQEHLAKQEAVPTDVTEAVSKPDIYDPALAAGLAEAYYSSEDGDVLEDIYAALRKEAAKGLGSDEDIRNRMHELTASAAAGFKEHYNTDIADLIKIGKTGKTFHSTTDDRKTNGQFISVSQANLDAIRIRKDDIRESTEAWNNYKKNGDQPGDLSHEQLAVRKTTSTDLVPIKSTEKSLLPVGSLVDVKYPTRSAETIAPIFLDLTEAPKEAPTSDAQENGRLQGPSMAELADSMRNPSIAEGENKALDDEKQSIWGRVKGRSKKMYGTVKGWARDSKSVYLTAGNAFGQAMYTVGGFLPTPSPKLGETSEEFEARVKRLGMIKVVGALAVYVAVKYVPGLVHGLEAGTSSGHTLSPDELHSLYGHIGGSDKAPGGIALSHGVAPQNHVELAAPPPAAPPAEFSAAAHTVTSGEGWYQTFNEMHITNETEQVNLLDKVGPQLQSLGWAEPMDGGSWGISHTGQLPDSVLELIQSSR